MPGQDDIAKKNKGDIDNNAFIEIIETGLCRLNLIYACSNQQVLDNLHARGLIPLANEVRKNASNDRIDFGNPGFREAFIEVLNNATWQDPMIYKTAQRLFPDTVQTPLASDDEILSELEQRFGVTFDN